MKKFLILSLFVGLLIGCDQPVAETVAEAPVATETVVSNIPAEDLWLGSLITATPQEGRELAIMMARKTIGAIQKDPEVKKRLRADYAEDSEQLILSAQVVAIEFQTVAAANNYWKK